MSKKLCLCFILCTVLAGLLVGPACAEVAFKWGPYLRVRHEYWKNTSDFENSTLDNRSFFRIKTSLWGQATIDKNITLYAKLTNENRAHTYRVINGKKDFHFDIDEVIFDNLYFDIKNVLSLPFDIRVGRQELAGQYGENFLFSDGTPADGSRTSYFDAVKTTWRINPENSLDLVLIKNDKSDEKLPVINRLDGPTAMSIDGDTQLNTSDEKAIAVYHKMDPSKSVHLENYYVYKQEEGGASKLSAKKTKLNTIGSYAKYTMAPWTLKGQLAVQEGEYGQDDREGLGGYVFVTRDFKDVAFTPVLNVGYMYLSGDDQGDSKNTAFDPLFSRWPAIADVYTEIQYLNLSTETGALGYWTNMQVYKVGLSLVPLKKTKLSLAYYMLRANEAVSSSTSSIFSGTEKNRGKVVTAKLDYAFNKNLSVYLLGEFFHPGDFYVSTRDDSVFVRSQMELKF